MLISKFMTAVQLVGHGGYDKQIYSETVLTPIPAPNEVLIRVLAAGINNTDINTRIGWYSKENRTSTAESKGASESRTEGSWTGEGLSFPRIQGADVCGEIVGLGGGVPQSRMGERVIVQSCLCSLTQGGFTPWLGSERDGAFAQYVCAPSADSYCVRCDYTDAELAAIPCAFATAENLISRTRLAEGEKVLITGASGNVGIAAIQLAKRRGAEVCVIAASNKFDSLTALGANTCLERGAPIAAALGTGSINVVIDVVGGPQWTELLDVLKPTGRYAVSGAIAGPMVQMDLRKLYLKDLTLFGCTTQDANVFINLIGYIERAEIRPIVTKQYPLRDIAQAQEDFLAKKHLGKFVMIPPSD